MRHCNVHTFSEAENAVQSEIQSVTSVGGGVKPSVPSTCYTAEGSVTSVGGEGTEMTCYA